ncbi:hypothetical protein GCM10023198_26520 [Promicromonospora umidemergens]|uniref:Uncharacterized protein n=1 Tax=Promicromonospora umidemergens TaxID=629679 RepID=A0ABP8XAJ1_9MICO
MRRSTGKALDRVGGAVLRTSSDRTVHTREQRGELRWKMRREVFPHLPVGQPVVAHGPAGDLGDDRGDVVVAERLRAGQHEVGVGRATGGQGVHGDGGDVLDVDESDAAALCRAQDHAVRPDAAGVEMTAREVLHEPRGSQHRPLVEQAWQSLVHSSHRWASRRHSRRAEQDRTVNPLSTCPLEKGQHHGRRVRVADGRNQVDPVDPAESVRMRRRVVPVEPDRLSARHRGRTTAGRPHPAAGGDQLRGGAAPGGARSADDQHGVGGGHRPLLAKSAPGALTTSGFQ